MTSTAHDVPLKLRGEKGRACSPPICPNSVLTICQIVVLYSFSIPPVHELRSYSSVSRESQDEGSLYVNKFLHPHHDC